MVQGKKKGNAGYVSSSIFKPSSSDTGDAEPDIDDVYMRQSGASAYDNEARYINAKPQLRHHSTQKVLKLKQLRLKEK